MTFYAALQLMIESGSHIRRPVWPAGHYIFYYAPTGEIPRIMLHGTGDSIWSNSNKELVMADYEVA